MAVHFHSLKIREVKKETAECVSVCFDVPDNLLAEFEFREGQNITLKKQIGHEEVRRSYSICMAPYEKQLRVAIKKVAGGLFSKFANDELKAGDAVDVLPPTGKFNARIAADKAGNYLAIAAGSGITPIISIIKHTLQTQTTSSFTLIYSNKNRNSIIFFEELEAIKNKYIRRFNFINVLSRERTDADIFYGRIDEKKLEDLDKLVSFGSYDAVYVCGPESMIFSANDFLQKKGIDKKNIHFELFSTPGQTQQKKTIETIEEADKGPKSNVTIKLDGRSFAFNLPYNGQSILDGALQQGADLPYACKGGVCATCRAKLVEGKVDMDVNYALEPEEIEQGFILTCQAHPKTGTVSVNFDIK
ncbi:MAG: 1,2-phenylacetyl-CoA epoxidase subunit PaaE [Ferruginibacter sp.]